MSIENIIEEIKNLSKEDSLTILTNILNDFERENLLKKLLEALMINEPKDYLIKISNIKNLGILNRISSYLPKIKKEHNLSQKNL